MGLKKFIIAFDKPNKVFFAEDVVTGRVIVDIDSPKKLQRIELKIKGEARIQLFEYYGKKVFIYEGYEQYFVHQFLLYPAGPGVTTLPAGEYVYPFKMQLPSNIPSSFEDKNINAYIRYTATAVIFRPRKHHHRKEIPFTVINPLDLNAQESAKKPAKQEAQMHIGWWCCKSLPLSMVVTLPVSGYVPGQEIPITIEVDNASNRPVSSFKCELMQTVSVKASGQLGAQRTKTAEYDVARITFPNVPTETSEPVTTKLKVPGLPPSNLGICNVIDIAYKLKVTAKIEGYVNLDLSIPIIIGIIPLQSDQSAISLITESQLQTSTAPSRAQPNISPPSGMCI